MSWSIHLRSGRPVPGGVFERAPGVLGEELPFSAWNSRRFETLGRAVGLFHARARSYLPPPGLERPDWDQSGNCFNPGEHIADPLLARRRAERLCRSAGFAARPAGLRADPCRFARRELYARTRKRANYPPGF